MLLKTSSTPPPSLVARLEIVIFNIHCWLLSSVLKDMFNYEKSCFKLSKLSPSLGVNLCAALKGFFKVSVDECLNNVRI